MKRSSEEKMLSPVNDVPEKEGEAAWWQPSLVLFSRLSGWIGIPIIIGLFVGKWLDERYKTEPWLFLLSVGVAFVGSSIGIVKEARKAMEEIVVVDQRQKRDKENKPDLKK